LKKVLYISYDGLTDALGQSQVLPYVVGLSKLGYSFTLISCEKPDKWEKGRDQIEAICKEHQINWQPILYHKKLPVISAMQNISNFRKLAFQLHRQHPFSMVHCRSYIPSVVGLELKRKNGIPFIFDMRGFYADERVDGKVWNLSNPIYRLVFNFFKSKEKAYVQHSDAIVSLTEAGKEIMEQWPTLKYKNKITVIPCSVDMDLFDREKLDPEKLNTFKKEINSTLVIGYYGSIGTWYMLDEMLDQFVSIHKKYPAAKFLIVSNDLEGMDIEKILSEKGIDKNSVVITSCGRTEMPYYISITDVALFFIKPCFSKLASSPTKHGEIMSMGKPLITNSGVGDMDAIVHSTRSGYAITAFNTAEYDAATDQIETLRKLDPMLIRQEGMKIYSLESAIKKYAGIYETVLGKEG
jgi:glycosyltransferase involved in cell wall biosynthesis